MTRDAAGDTVKGDFDNATYDYQGLKTTFLREGEAFFMRTVDPNWALMRAKLGAGDARLPPPQYTKIQVHRTVGSHWVQEYLHKEPNGSYTRMPVMYHIAERRWIHSHGGFLAPESDDFWAKCRGFTWNETCLFCHNTSPVQNPKRGPRGPDGFDTRVAELGISCEACHGPAGDHVRLNQNPARRLDLALTGAGDPSIVNPSRLSVERRDEICARCHGGHVPKPGVWDRRTGRDPFIAGQPLAKHNQLFWSEAEQLKLAGKPAVDQADGRFWGDGTPLTTGLEYNGMALSPCYKNGKGDMSCLSCHTMHADDPNFLLKPKMNTNDACLQCHGEYRNRIAEHSRHAVDSAGSQCVSCHMPHQVYSLLTTHLSHRVQIPEVKDSVGTGKPHACNLCHLDKSLGWTQNQLAKWPNGEKRRAVLSDDERNIAASILWLATGDARTRVVVAGAFQRSESGARAAPSLAWLLGHERYPMVRNLLDRGLRTGRDPLPPYDYMATSPVRAGQLAALRAELGPLDDSALKRLLKERKDPDLTINE